MMISTNTYDVIIIGGGIAGASIAYFLTDLGVESVLMLEKEEHPGYHATGRAAGVLVEFDPVPSVLKLKVEGAKFLRRPPDGFAENPLLYPSGILILFKGEWWALAGQLVPAMGGMGVNVQRLSPAEVKSIMPVVSERNFDGAILLPEDGRIDVHEILWSYIRHAKRRDLDLRCGEEVKGVWVEDGRAIGVSTSHGEYRAPWIVNAAGAWSDVIGRMAGAVRIGLTPMRRTIVTFATPAGLEARAWPLVADLSHSLYFSPESSGLLASPMDEDPMEPCDAKPDDIVVATTMERLRHVAPILVPKSLKKKWAGLRTFAPDQAMVVGEDPLVKGFFWLAGQGGAGIETSPAVGRMAAELITNGTTERMDARVLDPRRFV